MANNSFQNGLGLYYDSDRLILEFNRANVLGHPASNSESPILTYSVYQRYLSEQDYDEENFLSSLSTLMLQPDDIVSHGFRINPDFVIRNGSKGSSRLIHSSYPGTASLFAVIVTTNYPNQNNTRDVVYSSLYVTTATYACQLDPSQPMSCKRMWATLTKVLCGVSIFFGGFLAFFGHRHFKTQQFTIGTYSLGIVVFILAAYYDDGAIVSYNQQLGMSVAIGVVGMILSNLVLICRLKIIFFHNSYRSQRISKIIALIFK